MGRSIGLDVHRDFCQVAIADGGRARSAGRIATSPEMLELFAQSLAPTDRVVMEATGNALAIARILQPYVAEVVLAHAKQVRAISHARIKTDKIDAKVLADLLAADLIPAVWIGDERVRMLRRLVSRRRGLVKRRTQIKNEISAALHRNLKGRSPASDPFGKKGREWIAAQQLPIDERLTVDGGLRQLDFFGGELAEIDRLIAQQVLDDADVRRLLTIPGIDVVTAATLVATIGDVRRFPTSRRLVGYLGLHPTIRQSGNGPARHGRLSKQGSAAARHVLVEAAWSAAKAPGPLRAFAQRTAARRGRHVATVAVARKLAVLACYLLTRGEDYAFARPGLVRRKIRALELKAGAARAKPGPNPDPVWNTTSDAAEKRLAEQAELTYRRLVCDWQASGPKVGAGATPERASQGPSKGKAARQATSS
jgi:transposase